MRQQLQKQKNSIGLSSLKAPPAHLLVLGELILHQENTLFGTKSKEKHL